MSSHFTKNLSFICFFFFITSCANYKLHEADMAKDWKTQKADTNIPITHSIYLIGDVGMGSRSESNMTLTLLKKHLDGASENSSVLFLGNNASPNGMSSKSNKEHREKAEFELDRQIAILENFKGQPIFLPGNRDWGRYGWKGLKRQEKYIESALNKGIEDDDDWNNYFLPDRGCPGPEVVEINDDLVVIVIDSQWWLMNWDEEPNVNVGCEVKSREEFALLIEATIKDHKNKNIVFASHHSFRSVGPRGGRFTLGNHLFPFTTVSKNAYVPLPGVGSLFLFLRSAGIFQQDEANLHYKELRQATIRPARANGEYIFVSGHDHSLQYLKDKGQHFVVSGSGSKKTATAKNAKTMFSYGQHGFSKIDFHEDGSAWVTFFTPNAAGGEGTEVFRYKMKGPLPKTSPDDIPKSFPEYETGIDSLLTFPSKREIKPLKNFATFMLGKRRREVYLEKNRFATLDLSTFKGGMTVIKKGGGKQTNSLRLLGADGKEYVMRSLTKDANRGVPYPFNQLVVVNYLFSETFLGSHCFAPPTLPALSDAANIYHTNPNIYYIPKQPALGVYNDHFGGEVYVVEERPSKSWPEADFFGNAEKFVSTPKLFSKLERNYKHKVDQHWVARSRLFDMLIGDIDRHGDQWRWAVHKTAEGHKEYRPIPRDRDNAYCTYDGFAFKLLKPYHYIVRMLGVYDETVDNPQWTYYNARHFDHNFLNQLSLEDWQKEAKYIQENVTDEVIREALTFFPKRIYEMTGANIEKVLKARRDNLQETAKRMYLYLAEKSMIHGTEKREYFEVIRKDGEHTEVNMYASNKKGEKKERHYHRIFKTSETKELYIYGLDNDDIFHISGEVDKGIKLYVVGGPGDDTFIDVSKVGGMGKKDRFYDTKKGNKMELGSEGKNKTSDMVKNNTFEYLGTYFDKSTILPVPLMGYSAGDGFKIGFMGIYHSYRFNKAPLGSQHKLGANFAFATKGVDLFYNGVFYETTGHWDFVLNTELRNDRYSFNYFGLGNESDQDAKGIDFYRVQQSLVHLDLGWQRRFANDIGTFSLRPLAEYTALTNTKTNFIDIRDGNGLEDKDYESKWYAGAMAEMNFINTDNPVSPRDGFSFNNKFTWQKSISGPDRQFGKFATAFTMYKSIGKRKALVFASRVGTEFIDGDYDFFYAPALGQDENLRGYFGQRYRGKANFFHTTDLRMGLGSFRNAILPFSFGITGSFDYGRIFEPDENSDLWHASFGGGIWFVPLNLAIIRVAYDKSLDGEGGQFKFGLGHAF